MRAHSTMRISDVLAPHVAPASFDYCRFHTPYLHLSGDRKRLECDSYPRGRPVYFVPAAHYVLTVYEVTEPATWGHLPSGLQAALQSSFPGSCSADRVFAVHGGGDVQISYGKTYAVAKACGQSAQSVGSLVLFVAAGERWKEVWRTKYSAVPDWPCSIITTYLVSPVFTEAKGNTCALTRNGERNYVAIR